MNTTIPEVGGQRTDGSKRLGELKSEMLRHHERKLEAATIMMSLNKGISWAVNHPGKGSLHLQIATWLDQVTAQADLALAPLNKEHDELETAEAEAAIKNRAAHRQL